MKRAARAAWWVIPGFVCLAVYWPGLRAWFQQDDFAWLALKLRLAETGDIWTVLFEPMAQGTIRPLSERAFFLGLYSLFGLDALPFRIVAFATQLVNLTLAASITNRLTGSRTAGFCAALFWGVSSAAALPMSWSSAYNQILCAFFLLTSFHFLLRYIETGRRGYWLAQWVSFLLGFGALEINVVYPALAAAYTLLCARKYFRKTLWLFVPSALFVAAHWWFAAKPESGLYEMHFGPSMAGTLWTYWRWALGPERLAMAGYELPAWAVSAATAVLTVSLLGFAVWQLRRRRWLAAFLLVWFLAVIGPVLPLRDHVSVYYLTVAAAGLAMLGGWAFASAWRGRAWWKAVATLAAALYMASSIPAARTAAQWNYERSRAVRNLVRGLERAHELHPGKIILLTRVKSDLFWAGINHKPYRLLGLRDVYLAPGSESGIEAHPELGEAADFVLPAAPALLALEEGRAVVYAADGERLKNVTALYRAVARTGWVEATLPRRLDAGSPLFAAQLGPEWYALEGGYRWMPKKATLRLGGPERAGQKLYVSGFCPSRQLAAGPLRMTVAVDSHRFPPVVIDRGDSPFEFGFPLPAEAIGKRSMDVAVEVERTFVVPSDGRPLGLVFGNFAVR
ncbi:MAG TPA: hypothetical protein VLE22_12015 [Bryobacteraceae bacterium]|nr:hypothetical protein [Bryobacteraceae bacterium]